MSDPRYLMADVYRALRRKAPDLVSEFNEEINSCNGPDHAIEICYKFLTLAEMSEA